MSRVCSQCNHQVARENVWANVQAHYDASVACTDLVYKCPKCTSHANVFSSIVHMRGSEPPDAYGMGELSGSGAASVQLHTSDGQTSVRVYKQENYPWLFVEVWRRLSRATYSVCCDHSSTQAR